MTLRWSLPSLRLGLDIGVARGLREAMSSTLLSSLSAQQLRRAASLRERIDALEKELTKILGVTVEPASGSASAARQPKKRFSAKTRARMAAAQKARWAARKAGKPAVVKAAAPVQKAKRHISAAGRAKMAAAAKARWAKVKAAGKKRL